MLDLLIKNCRLVDVKTGEISKADIPVKNGMIWEEEAPKETFDAKGAYAVPGFIDAHVHTESAFVTARAFSAATLQYGTTTVIADPHEICNVMGLEGLSLLIKETKNLPTNFFFCVPSCVPMGHIAAGGGEMGVSDVEKALSFERVVALGEIMDIQAVLDRDRTVIKKIEAAKKKKKIVCGHGPSLTGNRLEKYFSAGIANDHENYSGAEIREKLEYGIKILLRESSASMSPSDFYKLIPEHPEDFMFCTDNEYISHIIKGGHINRIITKAISYGVDSALAYRCASYNAAEHFGLMDVGDLSKGKRADIVLLKDIKQPVPIATFCGGIRYAPVKLPVFEYPEKAMNSIKCDPVKPWDFFVAVGDKTLKIMAFENSIFTEKTNGPPFNKITVVNRYGKNRVGIGFIDGFDLEEGAIASSVSHDCHNIICVGAEDESIASAINEIVRMCGGLVAMKRENILAALPLEICGLMSQEPTEKVVEKLDACNAAAKSLGCKMTNPFTTLSFMALEAVPRLKITDAGMVDVEKAEIVRN